MNNKDTEKISIDARPFPEIWKSLSVDYEQPELRHRLISNRCCSTPQTVWNWGAGNTKPQEPLVLEKVAKVVSDFLTSISTTGPVKCNYRTLFPSR